MADSLRVLGASGHVGFDVFDGRYFQRVLPFDVSMHADWHPRLLDARELIKESAVQIVRAEPFEAAVVSGDVEQRVREVDGELRCTCPWFAKHQGSRGTSTAGRQTVTRQRLRALFRRGRISLVIGLMSLAAAILASRLLDALYPGSGLLTVVRESLLIGGWVAMWRPIEIFLYDWWPIRAEARLFARLGAMPVRIKYGSELPSRAWQQDWPTVSQAQATKTR